MARTLAQAREHARPSDDQILARVIAGAVQLQQQGSVAEAALLYQRVLQVNPHHFDALHLLGVARQQEYRSEEALRLIDAALRIVPDSADALSNRGVALKTLRRFDEALASYDAALAINSEQMDALVNRMRMLVLLERHEHALDACVAVLERNPKHTDALRHRGQTFFKLGKFADALADYDQALALEPGDIDALNGRCVVLLALYRFEEALDSIDQALAINPADATALSNRGSALFRLKRFSEALRSCDAALALCPDHATALNNRGIVLAGLHRFDEALASYARALALEPDNAEIHYNYALVLLAHGDFRAGWREYEWRRKSLRWKLRHYNFTQPLWLGDAPVEGKTVLLQAEQGMGDSLQFIRYASLLARRGANVIVEVPRPLKKLIAEIPSIKVVVRGEELPAFDLHSALMSMPLAFGTEVATIPAEVPYIPIPQTRVAKWRDRLGGHLGKHRVFRVGVAWEGSALHEDNRGRSIALDRFATLFSNPGIEFVSFQRDMALGDAATLQRFSNVVDLGEELTDFADSAAVVSLLDVVVTIDTALAHLAGAVGKPVWILLPFNPDFRWMLDRGDSPWYPTARLFRQSTLGDWNEPLDQVRRALISFTSGE